MRELNMNALRLHARAALDQPLAITSAALAELRDLAEGRLDGAAFRPGDPLPPAPAATVRDGVAVIPVRGFIFPAGGLLSRVYPITSPARIAADLDAALSNSAVDAWVLDMDTPGGAVAGIAELARELRAATAVKPGFSYASGSAASAGYWLAAAASQVVIEDTAMLGSIGILTAAAIQVQPDFAGMQLFEVTSSNAPNKRPDPRTADGLAELRRMIDAAEAVFIDAVAGFRGVGRDVVIADFGRGGMRIGADAVAAGMADRVGSFEEVIAAAQAAGRGRSTSRSGGAARPSITGAIDMDLASLTAAALAAGRADLVAELRQGYVPAADATRATETAVAAAVAAARVEGATAERARISGILDLARAMPADTSAVGKALRDPAVDVGAAAVAILQADDARRAAGLAALTAGDPAGLKPGQGEGADDTRPAAAGPVALDDVSLKATFDGDAKLRGEFGDFATFAAFARADASGLVKARGKAA